MTRRKIAAQQMPRRVPASILERIAQTKRGNRQTARLANLPPVPKFLRGALRGGILEPAGDSRGERSGGSRVLFARYVPLRLPARGAASAARRSYGGSFI